MEKTKLQEYTFRVTQASRSELIVIMYDVILTDTQTAREALEKGDIEQFEHDLRHAGRFINELMGALDYRYEISYDLLSLYSYINKTMIRARFKRDVSLLSVTDDMLSRLRDSFAEVSRQDTSGPMMRNTEQVYAGLTYGKNSLNESRVDVNAARRGFMA